MLIRCSICDAVWMIEPELGQTRQATVECVDCGHPQALDGLEVAAQAAAPAASFEFVPDVADAPVAWQTSKSPKQFPGSVSAAAAPSIGRRAPFGLILGLAGLGICVLAVARRDTVVRALPGAAPVFAAMGLPVNLRGLELLHLQSRILEDGAQRILAVEGEVANLRSKSGVLPELLVSVRSSDGRVIYSWSAPMPKKDIGVGETVYFRARLAAPPIDGKDVKVQFASVEPIKVANAKK